MSAKHVIHRGKECRVLFFKDHMQLREWFHINHEKEKEVWVGFYKQKSSIAAASSLKFSDALDEALCFGWIDGVQKTIDVHCYCNRFTPRAARSNWSQRNIQRFERLSKANLIEPAGYRVREKRCK